MQVVQKCANMNQKLYRTEQLAALLGVSKGTIWRMQAAGQLPKGFKLTSAQTVWDAAEIEQWLEDKKAARFNPTPQAPAVVVRGINPIAASNRPGRPRKMEVPK